MRRLLRDTVELQEPASAAAVRRLAELNPCPPEARALAALAEKDDRPTLVEVAERRARVRRPALMASPTGGEDVSVS